jgi:hypothetical protein
MALFVGCECGALLKTDIVQELLAELTAHGQGTVGVTPLTLQEQVRQFLPFTWPSAFLGSGHVVSPPIYLGSEPFSFYVRLWPADHVRKIDRIEEVTYRLPPWADRVDITL